MQLCCYSNRNGCPFYDSTLHCSWKRRIISLTEWGAINVINAISNVRGILCCSILCEERQLHIANFSCICEFILKRTHYTYTDALRIHGLAVAALHATCLRYRRPFHSHQPTHFSVARLNQSGESVVAHGLWAACARACLTSAAGTQICSHSHSAP